MALLRFQILSTSYFVQPLSETMMWIETVHCNQWWGGNGCQGFFYQMEDEGKRARQRQDRERVCERDRA